MALAGMVPGAHYMWHRASDLRARRPLAPEGSAAMSRNGFTLIELLIVVVKPFRDISTDPPGANGQRARKSLARCHI